jgi:negative regulator of genetic competence, sporulation and motility
MEERRKRRRRRGGEEEKEEEEKNRKRKKEKRNTVGIFLDFETLHEILKVNDNTELPYDPNYVYKKAL